MKPELMTNRIVRRGERGLTFVELIVTTAILAILAMCALPVARFEMKRQTSVSFATTCG